MKREKDFIVLQKERFSSEVSKLIEETISSLADSAKEMGQNDRSFVGETLLFMMFTARLENRLFSDDQTTENMDNESEATL